MDRCASSVPDAEILVAEALRERGNGRSGPARLRNGEWEGVLGDERAMILAATFRIAKNGYHQLSVSRICREAGVSQRNFSRHFESLADCFVAALEERASGAIEAWVHGRDASATWGRTVYESLHALCEAIEDDRDWARVLFVDITAAGTTGIDSRDRLVSQVARTLQTTAPKGQAPTGRTAEAAIAAAWIILRRLTQDENLTTLEALPVLTLLVLPESVVKKRSVREEKHIYTPLDFP
jgi:AcrR family transcriptional regulator